MPIVSGNGGASSVLFARKTLAHADILALPTTPFEIIPASAGKIIVPTHAVLALKWVADYSNFNASGQLGFSSSNSPGAGDLLNIVWDAIVGTGPSVLLGNGEGEMMVFQALAVVSGNASYPRTPSFSPDNLVGSPLNLTVDNNVSGNYTGGDAANKLLVAVTYYLLAWPP